jgi:hypothetical protein
MLLRGPLRFHRDHEGLARVLGSLPAFMSRTFGDSPRGGPGAEAKTAPFESSRHPELVGPRLAVNSTMFERAPGRAAAAPGERGN